MNKLSKSQKIDGLKAIGFFLLVSVLFIPAIICGLISNGLTIFTKAYEKLQKKNKQILQNVSYSFAETKG